MKTTAAECASAIRKVGMIGSVVLGDEICAHLDAKAAIDSAVPGEIVALEQRVECLKAADEATLKYLGMARNERDAARAEVERLKDLVDEFKAATMLDVNGDPDGVTPRLLEGHVTALRTEIDRLQAARTALAQENARLINEVGELDSTARKHRRRAEVLTRGIVAYRTGSFTLAQVWENGEGKAVQ